MFAPHHGIVILPVTHLSSSTRVYSIQTDMGTLQPHQLPGWSLDLETSTALPCSIVPCCPARTANKIEPQVQQQPGP
jgi:hypothetical protein